MWRLNWSNDTSGLNGLWKSPSCCTILLFLSPLLTSLALLHSVSHSPPSLFLLTAIKFDLLSLNCNPLSLTVSLLHFLSLSLSKDFWIKFAIRQRLVSLVGSGSLQAASANQKKGHWVVLTHLHSLILPLFTLPNFQFSLSFSLSPPHLYIFVTLSLLFLPFTSPSCIVPLLTTVCKPTTKSIDIWKLKLIIFFPQV